MDQHEIELLTKARQTAHLLSADLMAIQRNTDCAAMEELMLATIEQVANLIRLLGRLSSQR